MSTNPRFVTRPPKADKRDRKGAPVPGKPNPRRKDMTDMTPEHRIDAALAYVLHASGSALKHYTLPGTLEAMREAMRKVMSDSYIQGSNDCHKAMTGGRK